MGDVSAGNLLFVLSDEHNRGVLGCYGNPAVRTPNLDQLAMRGTRFANAYCNSPICVPARAALATGRYPHNNRCWDNATPYHGQPQSWHHVLRDAGHEVVSIGKLHFRSTDDDNGFSEERLPMHVAGGVGDLRGLLRRDPPIKSGTEDLAANAGAGESSYARYDRAIADEACAWLQAAATRQAGKPWVLFVSFVLPHFPLIAPESFFAHYQDAELPSPGFDGANLPPDHPVFEHMLRYFCYDRFFTPERRRTAVRAYYGMVSYLDHNVGRVLQALEHCGLARDTRVVYSSDHGDSLGNRGMWGKSTMYEDAVGVPLIVAGDDFPTEHVNLTPVSLVDLFPTFHAAVGVQRDPPAGVAGRSLFEIAPHHDPDRAVFAEYHASGCPTGMFMLRKGRWKLVHFEGYEPQLFDLETDPGELDDLGTDPRYAEQVAALRAELAKVVDTRAATELAFADQHAVIEQNGGVEGVLRATEIPYTPAPAAAVR